MRRAILFEVLSLCFLAAAANRVSAGQEKSIRFAAGGNQEAVVTLRGNTRPEAIAINDRGPVVDDFRLEHMMLLLRRSSQQEQALDEFIDQLTDPKSPSFHQWLTAQEFGQRFGFPQEDLDTISRWLESYGFTVNGIYSNGVLVDFSGNVGQVRRAFHTQIHHLLVNGKEHIANMTDPQIPATLAAMVAGVVSLSDFMPHPTNHPRAGYTAGSGSYLVVPADLATIYNFKPVFAAGHSGQGQTIVVIEDTDVYSTGDWDTFRSTFGLASAYPGGSFSQVNPPPRWDTTNCPDPGANADDGEAILDAEWASAAAPNAAIVLASCSNTTTTFAGFIALQNLLDSATPPAIVSISYADSETNNGETYNAAINATYQQAAAEGVSVFVSAGDWGGATSDATSPPSTYASYGINVNGFASTPYNVAVGGTDFSDTYNNVNSTYWSSSNTANYGSALSYIPEIPWNSSCASTLLSSSEGFPLTYGTSGFCNSTTGASFLTVVGGGGGPSACATGAPSTAGVVSGSCAGYAKPSWQSIYGNPSDGVRDLPDVSLFAASGVWGHYYVYCWTDTTNGGASCAGAPSTWSGAGGTSFAAPIMAGIQTLINQASASRSGNPNPSYYALATAEYGAGGTASCDASLGNGVASTCVFYDVTEGDMDVPCQGSHSCYLPSGTYGVLSTSNSAYQPAFGTNVGWDFATGIGTVNVYNLVKALGIPPAPAVSLSPPSVYLGQEPVGTNSLPQTVTLTNTGNAALSLSLPTITGGNSGDFSFNSNCASTLAAGNSCSINVDFDPTASGPRKSLLSVSDNAAGSPHTVLLTGIGTAASVSPAALTFASRTVGTSSTPLNATITNTAGATMHIWAIAILGTGAGDFSKTTTCNSTLAVGAYCTVSVTFKPTAVGTRTASLVFSDDAADSPQVVALTGGGLNTVITLGAGNAVMGNLSASAPAGHCNYNAPSDRYLFDLSGQSSSTVVTFQMTSTAFDSFVCVLDASNNMLAQDDDSLGNLNSTTTLSLAPAQYYVEASSFSGTGAGAYKLSALVATISTPGTLSLDAPRVVASLSSGAAYGACSDLYQVPADRWTFTLTATKTITIDVSSTSFLTTACLLDSANNTKAFDHLSGPGTNARLIYKNLTVGTYYLEVSSYSSPFAGGAYALSLHTGLPQGKPINLSSTQSGRLSPESAYGVCSNLYQVPADRWTFTLTAVKTITIDVSSTSSSFPFQTTACLLDSANNSLDFDNTSGPNTNARLIEKNLPIGTYYLEVSSASSPFAGGPYTLSLQTGLPPGTAISVGQTPSGNLSSGAAYGVCSNLYQVPADRWTFTLTAIKTVTIDVTPTSLSSPFRTTACLLDSGNGTLDFDNTSGPNTNARLIEKNLPIGTYYLEVSSASSPFAGGPYTLSLQTGLPPGTAISVGQTPSGNLSSGAAYGVCSNLYHVPADRWQFSLGATTSITITGTSTAFSPTVCLLDSTNTERGFNSSGSGGTAALSSPNLAAGTYYIEVSSASSPFAGGAYTLSLTSGSGGAVTGAIFVIAPAPAAPSATSSDPDPDRDDATPPKKRKPADQERRKQEPTEPDRP